MKNTIDAPLVSVIIPFFSNVNWLDEALESVLAQTYQNLEIIVVDDGSSESIEEVVRKYPSVTFIKNENGGAATARNLGIELSRGEYCAFLDSDDLWKKTKIEKQVGSLLASEYVWSATAYETFGLGDSKTVTPFNADGNCYDVLASSCQIQTSTIMVRSKELRANPKARFAVDMRNGQDIFLWLYLAQKYQLDVITEPLTRFRLRRGSTQSSVEAHIRVRSLLWRKMRQNILPLPKQTAVRIGYTLCDSLHKRCIHNGEASVIARCAFPFAWLLFRIGMQLEKTKCGNS